MQEEEEAGPSRLVAKRKPRSSHPDRQPLKRTKYPPALPPASPSSHPTTKHGRLQTLPNKVLQGQSTRRTENTKPGYGRDVVFVTRKVSLGALMGRCRSLLVDEGYTRITLYALTAAIPHAFLLLHALIDLLPYPKGPKGMWYEIQTDTTECTDEVDGVAAGADKDEFAGIGAIEAKNPERKTRFNSSIRIDLHITPRPPPKLEDAKNLNKRKKENRPSKQKRQALLRKRQEAQAQATVQHKQGQGDEEEMMNQQEWAEDEEIEAVEEIEER